MKIYVVHSSSFDFKNELYKPIRESKLNTVHEIYLPHEESVKPFSSEEFIKSCDLIIAEVSYPSTGQGIELGWADFVGVPIICIYKSGMKYSGALKTVSDEFIEYTDKKDMIDKLGEYLGEMGE
jgi:nucleoside 2-deoxyribosyltransferase